VSTPEDYFAEKNNYAIYVNASLARETIRVLHVSALTSGDSADGITIPGNRGVNSDL
jgi:hypothetical protein